MSISSRHSGRYSNPKGFTLIELMVVIAIMALVTAALLFSQARFDSSTLLRSLAYSVALSVRQTQIYGSSVLGTSVASQGSCVEYASGICYASAYGVHFAKNATSYLIFADLNNNGVYDSATDAVVKTFNFSTGYGITDICATVILGGAQSCFSNGGISKLDVVFRRPNPEACFSSDASSGACAQGATPVYTPVKITLGNSSDPTNTRSVTVTQTGEIAVCSTTGC